jgi:hypothetical protein
MASDLLRYGHKVARRLEQPRARTDTPGGAAMADATPERWQPIEGYEDLYEVSDHGRVRRTGASPYAKPGRILKPALAGRGYHRVTLYWAGRPQLVYIHGLVAEAFLGPRPAKHEVNHRDGNKTHNAAGNLEYVTPLGNSQHAVQTGLWPLGEQHHNAKLTAEQVAEIRRRYVPRAYSMARLAREFGVCAETIHRIVRGTAWTR